MSTSYRLISNMPLDWFLRSIVGSCGFREATAEERAGHHAAAMASFEKYHQPGTTETERLTYEIMKKRLFGDLSDSHYLMTSPAPAVDSNLNTDWLDVWGSDNKTWVSVDNIYRWMPEQQGMVERICEAIRASGFSADVYSEHEPQF